MNASVDEILDGKSLWGRYVASLVSDFQVQPSEAWRMSIAEYWSLHGYRYSDESSKKTKGIDDAEAKDMFAQLREKGVIE